MTACIRTPAVISSSLKPSPICCSRRARSPAQGAPDRHRSAAMGEFTVCLVHPGALPVTVYRPLAGALSPRVRLAILAMRLLQEYREAMTGGRRDVTVQRLAGGLAAPLPRQGRYLLAR